MSLAAALLLSAATGSLLPPPSPAPFAPGAPDPLLAFADETRPPSTLAAIVQQAVDDSPATGATSARALQAQAAVQESRAALYPRVDMEISGQQVISRQFSNLLTNALERSRPRQRVDGSLSVEQTLLDGGGAMNRLRAEKARSEAAGAELVVASEDIALDAITAFYDVWIARADKRLAGTLVDRNIAILEMTETRAKSGVGSRADVARVEASLASARARLTRAFEANDAADVRFRQITGAAPPDALVRAQGTGPIELSPDQFGPTVAGTQAVAAARARERAAALDVKAARSDQYPSISAGVDAQKYDFYKGNVDHDVRARLTLRHRLFGGGSGTARLDQAKARESEASFRARLVEEEAERDAGVAQAALVSAKGQSALLRDAYVATRQSRDAYAEEFRVSRGTLADLLQIEVALVDAASAYLRAVAREDLAGFTLLKTTGMLLPRLGVQPREIGRAS